MSGFMDFSSLAGLGGPNAMSGAAFSPDQQTLMGAFGQSAQQPLGEAGGMGGQMVTGSNGMLPKTPDADPSLLDRISAFMDKNGGAISRGLGQMAGQQQARPAFQPAAGGGGGGAGAGGGGRGPVAFAMQQATPGNPYLMNHAGLSQMARRPMGGLLNA